MESRGKGRIKCSHFTKSLVLFSGQLIASIVLTSVSSFHTGAGCWIVTCFSTGWGWRRRGCLALQGWMAVRRVHAFQSTRLTEVVAQLQKAQLLQSKGQSVDAALWSLPGRQMHKPCACSWLVLFLAVAVLLAGSIWVHKVLISACGSRMWVMIAAGCVCPEAGMYEWGDQ